MTLPRNKNLKQPARVLRKNIGFEILRFSNLDVLKNIEGVVERIFREIEGKV
ncbi:DUF559 domain-containing protein [bacterium]